jgi:hypothetical protein
MRTAAIDHDLAPVHELRQLTGKSDSFEPGADRTWLAELSLEFLFERTSVTASAGSQTFLKAV